MRLRPVIDLVMGNIFRNNFGWFASPDPKYTPFLSYELFFKIGIHFMQGRTATTRQGVTRKRNTKGPKHLRLRGNMFRKNVQLKYICQF